LELLLAQLTVAMLAVIHRVRQEFEFITLLNLSGICLCCPFRG
jgi:hypothetical protein